jgi:putative membrane protein
MQYLTQHWSFGPLMIVAIVLAIWHEIGLTKLAWRSTPEQARRRRLRSLWFYAGLGVLLLAVQSPIGYWSYDYFLVHMIQHLLLMFGAPTLVVAGAPWEPLLVALPRSLQRAAAGDGKAYDWTRPLRAVTAWLLRPWVSIVTFNLVMLFWHVPAMLDLAERNQTVHIWLMYTSFFLAGILFWLQFIDSPPFRRNMKLTSQAIALVGTNISMWLLAMAMGILTSVSWYPVYNHIAGVTLPPFADQQIGAGILWICGDFWAIPTLIYVMRRIIAEDGGVGAAVDKILGHGSTRYQWASRGPVHPVHPAHPAQSAQSANAPNRASGSPDSRV